MRLSELLRELFSCAAIAIEYCYLRPLSRKRKDGRTADTRRTPGDDYDLVAKTRVIGEAFSHWSEPRPLSPLACPPALRCILKRHSD